MTLEQVEKTLTNLDAALAGKSAAATGRTASSSRPNNRRADNGTDAEESNVWVPWFPGSHDRYC